MQSSATRSLQAAKRHNRSNTNAIVVIYLGSVITVVVFAIQSIAQSLERGNTVLKQIEVSLVLVLLSVFFFAFYSRFVIYIKETKAGGICSITLSLLLLALLALGIFTGYFMYIGIGLFFVFLKALQLYWHAKSEKIGRIIQKYLLRIVLLTLALTMISLVLGIVVDFQLVDAYRQPNEDQLLSSTKQLVTNLPIDSASGEAILRNLDSINYRYQQEQLQNRSFYQIGVYGLLIALIYALYKVALVRSISMESIFEELEKYYARQQDQAGKA